MTTDTVSGYVNPAAADGRWVLGKVMNDKGGVARWHFWTGDFSDSGPRVSRIPDKAMTFKTARDAYNAGGQFKSLQYFRAIDVRRAR